MPDEWENVLRMDGFDTIAEAVNAGGSSDPRVDVQMVRNRLEGTVLGGAELEVSRLALHWSGGSVLEFRPDEDNLIWRLYSTEEPVVGIRSSMPDHIDFKFPKEEKFAPWFPYKLVNRLLAGAFSGFTPSGNAAFVTIRRVAVLLVCPVRDRKTGEFRLYWDESQ